MDDKCNVTFSNGITKKYKKGTQILKISREFQSEYPFLCALVNNKSASLYDTVEYDITLDFLDVNSTIGNNAYVAGLKMVFQAAVDEIEPDTTICFNYTLPSGIVTRVHTKKHEVNVDLVDKIKNKMNKIIAAGLKFEKVVVNRDSAINYYNNLCVLDKANNIRNIVDGTVVLYRLNNLVNYYYSEMPVDTSALKVFDVVYLKDDMVLLRYPNEYQNGVLSEYVDYKNLVKTYVRSRNWLGLMKIVYVSDINNLVTSGHIHDFIRSSELKFDSDINDIAKYISQNKYIKYVCIAGPSSSGKTTISKRLSNYFEVYGMKPIVISVDDYYKERIDTPKDENGEYDFECLEALDLQYLANDVEKLVNGEEVTLPRFNFYTGKKELTSKKVKLTEDNIIIFEGLHSINDEMLPFIDPNEKYKIYISPLMPLYLDDHNFISNKTIRLLRRIARDFRTRGYSPESTIKSNHKVCVGEGKHITPFIPKVNKVLNTALPYEIGVLKVLVEPLLFSVPVSSPYYNEARRLLSFLKQFFTINLEFVPKDSIIREFIGGNDD